MGARHNNVPCTNSLLLLRCDAHIIVQTILHTQKGNNWIEEYYVIHLLHDIVEVVSRVGVLCVVGYPWVSGDERVLRPDVHRVVDLPVDIANLAGRVEQALKELKNNPV
jgi:hypothetical protein